jgi:hypothetical protein
MSALSGYLQNAITILVTALYAADSEDQLTQQAADVLCGELTRKITGAAESDADYQRVTELGKAIADQGWIELKDVVSGDILMPYQKE